MNRIEARLASSVLTRSATSSGCRMRAGVHRSSAATVCSTRPLTATTFACGCAVTGWADAGEAAMIAAAHTMDTKGTKDNLVRHSRTIKARAGKPWCVEADRALQTTHRHRMASRSLPTAGGTMPHTTLLPAAGCPGARRREVVEQQLLESFGENAPAALPWANRRGKKGGSCLQHENGRALHV